MWILSARGGIKYFNTRSTENNEDKIASIQAEIEQINRQALRWTIATIIVGSLFWF